MKFNSYEGLLSLIGDLGVQANLNVLSGSLRIDGVTDGILRAVASMHHMVAENSVGYDRTPSEYHHILTLPIIREIAQMRDGLDYSVGVKEFYTTSIQRWSETTQSVRKVNLGYGRFIRLKQQPVMVEVISDPDQVVEYDSRQFTPMVPGTIITPRVASRGYEGIPRTFCLTTENPDVYLGSYAFADPSGNLVRVHQVGQLVEVDKFTLDGYIIRSRAKVQYGPSSQCYANIGLENHAGIETEVLFRPYTLLSAFAGSYDLNTMQFINGGVVGGDSFEGIYQSLMQPFEVSVIDAPFAKLSLLIGMMNRLRWMFSK